MNRKEEYSAYLQSDEWKNKTRELARKLGGKRCSVCGAKRQVDTHHKTYARIFHEELDDLVFLCRLHHFEEHKKNTLPRRRAPRHKHSKLKTPRVRRRQRLAAPFYTKTEELSKQRRINKSMRELRKVVALELAAEAYRLKKSSLPLFLHE